MRIGFFGMRFPKGVGILMEDFARTVEAAGHQAFFLTYPLSRRKGVLTKGDWARDNITIVDTFKRNSVEVSNEAIVKWVTDNQLDLVFTIEQPKNWNVFSICKKLGVPTINFVDIEMFADSDRYADCTAFFCATQQGVDILKQRGVHNVIGAEYRPNPDNFPWMERVVSDKVHFVMHNGWGGMHGRKGLEPTVRAYSKTIVDSRLTIITQKKWKAQSDEIKNLVAKDARIEVLEVNDTDNVYNSAAYEIGHVAIQPSLWEGLGLTYIEAMMCGMPVITCDGPPMNQYVTDRRTGVVVQCEQVPGDSIKPGLSVPAFVVNENRLAEAIATVANNPEYVNTMSNNTKQFAQQYQQYVQQFCQLLEVRI